jgi:hypothetical protein
MRLPFFSRREQSDAAKRERSEELERSLASTLRVLATAFTRLADGIEKRRLTRAGYKEPERFLERTDPRK